MTIELIVSYDDYPQEFIDLFNVPDDAMLNAQRLFNYIISENGFTESELLSMYKISCCAITDKTLPTWFMEANGKLYVKNGKLDTDE